MPALPHLNIAYGRAFEREHGIGRCSTWTSGMRRRSAVWQGGAHWSRSDNESLTICHGGMGILDHCSGEKGSDRRRMGG
jgi:hypothetical protein